MRFAFTLMVGLLVTALAAPAWAEKEEVMLKSGRSGMVEVTETRPDGITVKFPKSGAVVTIKVKAPDLDPHSFYNVRRKHMEKTAENHVRLAVFCAENGMFKRGTAQMEAAKALDPEIEQKIKDAPEVMEKIADRLVEAARKHYKDGNVELCYDIAVLITTKLPNTKGADLAVSVLDKLEKEVEDKRAAKVASRQKKIDDAKEEAGKKAAQGRHDVMSPLEKVHDQAHKQLSKAYRAKKHKASRDGFESAAKKLDALVKKIDAASGKAGDDAELKGMLSELRGETVADAIKAYVGAGTMYLNRQSVKNAEDLARAALALDPDSSAAKSFMTQVTLAASDDGWGRGGGRR